MTKASRIPRSPDVPAEADYAVTLYEPDTGSVISPGQTVYVRQTDTLADGDVGLFRVNGRMMCRQICQDSFGTVYLFPLDRGCRSADISLSAAERESLLCYGKVLLPQALPLPTR